MKSAKALTLTYLTPVSFASLNGSDKEADNISSIKKIKVGKEEFPYVSSQAVRRALRNQLEVLGRTLSEGEAAKITKGLLQPNRNPKIISTMISLDIWVPKKLLKGKKVKPPNAHRLSVSPPCCPESLPWRS